MGVFEAMHRGIDDLRELPGVRHLRRAAYDKQFGSARATHLFRGVFGSYQEAQADAPATAPVGYDNPASTDLYVGATRPDAWDYPAFFWLWQSINAGCRAVADLGGNVGFKFHALHSMVQMPADLRWLVIDVPEVVRRGRELKAQDAGARRPQLEFSADYASIDGVDVLYASGSLQYLPISLEEILSALRSLPARIVINTTPVHPSRSFFTLNSIGSAYCPYRVQSRAELIRSVEQLGYTLRDHWTNPGKSMTIPFTDGYDLQHYAGFCFDR